jgi:hypothetical protein
MDTMKAKAVNSVRRQVLIAGVCVVTTPTLPAWAAYAESSKLNNEKKLVLSGRLIGVNGTAISGAMVELANQKVSTLTDADGRFMLISSMPVDHNVAVLVAARTGERSKKFLAEPSYSNVERNGVLRSSVSLKI